MGILLCVHGACPPVLAGGFLAVTSSGAPIRWSAPSSIPFNPDRGTLGYLSQNDARAYVANSFTIWARVSSTSARFVDKGLLPANVSVSNYTNYLSKGDDGLNPIIYDTDGSITDALFGRGASQDILGFAAPLIRGEAIAEGESVLNGLFVDSREAADVFAATMVHEFGHYIGLDHTQINSFTVWNGDTEDDYYLPTMYPTATDNDLWLVDLNPDDAAWVTELYPAGGLSLGAIEGRILTSVGGNFNGANVTARGAADPFYNAVSCVSGFRSPASAGAYRLPRLKPGRYTVGVDQVLPGFTGGSSVGPFDPPKELPGPVELYNGTSESSSALTDAPEDSLTLKVNGSSTLSNINIRLNSAAPSLTTRYENEPNNTTATAMVLTDSTRVRGNAGADDAGDISFGEPDPDDIEDLYFLDFGNAANIDVTLNPDGDGADLDLAGFFTSLYLFASERNFPPTNNSNESFGPVEIPPDGAYVGVAYWDQYDVGPTSYTLDVRVARFPLGIDRLSPSSLFAGVSNRKVTVYGSGFSPGATVAFPDTGIRVNSVRYLSYYQLEIRITIPALERKGWKTVRVQNSSKQKGTLEGAFEVKVASAEGQWAIYE